jgi:hypothetical protein
MTQFWLATRPYNVIAAINRMAAATGSVRYAIAAADANYNGHAVSVYFNTYRGYWLADYTWSGRNVLARGSLESCLRAAKAEYDRGALGACVRASYPNPAKGSDHNPNESTKAFARLCLSAGYVEGEDSTWADEQVKSTWWTPLHDEVSNAMALEKHGIAPAVGFLANSKTLEEYRAKLDAHYAERRPKRAAR